MMLYYVRVTKTGSTSLVNCLDKNEINFKIHQFFKTKNNDIFYKNKDELYKDINSNNNYTFFTIVRNPWERLVSAWRYTTRCPSVFWNNTQMHNYSFKKFMTTSIDKFNIYQQEHFKCQFDMICDENNKIDYLKHIGKLENINDTLRFIEQKNNCEKLILPVKNKTKHKHYTEYYDEETKQIVAKKYAKDIEYFGYEFGK